MYRTWLAVLFLTAACAVQADGKILAAGSAYNGTNYDFAVTRYNTDGTLDTSFGGGDGVATFDIGLDDDYAYDMVLQSDGKILLSGSTNNGTNTDFAVMRLNSDGSLDTTFGGGDGVITEAVGNANDTAYGMALQADGSILLTGPKLVSRLPSLEIRWSAKSTSLPL